MSDNSASVVGGAITLFSATGAVLAVDVALGVDAVADRGEVHGTAGDPSRGIGRVGGIAVVSRCRGGGAGVAARVGA